MSYKEIIDKDFIADIQSRREFVSLKLTREILDKNSLSSVDDNDENDELRQILTELMVKTSNQIFVSTLMNPHTKIKRLLLKWSTGIGKTIGALLVAVSMIRLYEKIQLSVGTLPEKMPSIFVVGHTRERVIDDLLKFPEFGFITAAELARYRMLNRVAINGSPAEIAMAKDFYVLLKKRITNKAKGGYFRFFGYQELVNRIFGESSSDFILSLYSPDPETFRKNIADAAGKIKLNTTLLAEFNNSLLIVDEFHNLYNSSFMNSWGSTISYIVDNAINLRVIYMSATPATNNVGEYIHVVNLMTEINEFPRLTNFDSSEIGRRLIGRVSFLQDSDLRTYPKREFIGETIKVEDSELPYLKFITCPMSELHMIAYENWIEQKDKSDESDKPDIKEIQSQYMTDKDDFYIRDIALPNPEDFLEKSSQKNIDENSQKDNSESPQKDNNENTSNKLHPLFRAKESKIKISNASDKWKLENKIDVKEGRFVGEFLSKNNIGKYSGKYKRLIDDILSLPFQEKMVIFHNFVKMSGISMIAELLRQNGFIDIDSSATESTICAICGKFETDKIHDFKESNLKSQFVAEKSQSTTENSQSTTENAQLSTENSQSTPNKFINKISQSKQHKFYPCKFGMVFGEQPYYTNQRVLNIYNDPSNTRGIHMRILLGAQMITESADLKAVRHILITSMPRNIPIFLQIIGRGIRKGSHDSLPADEKICKIYIYISVFNKSLNQSIQSIQSNKLNQSIQSNQLNQSISNQTIEELNYKTKLADYIEIQHIEQIIHSNAADAAIHREIIMSPDVLASYGLVNDSAPVEDATEGIGTLYYKPLNPIFGEMQNDISYYAYELYNQEIYIIGLLLRRFFHTQPVWTYDELWKAIKNPPYRTEINTAMITEDNFAVGLNNLIIQTQKKNAYSWCIKKHDLYYVRLPKVYTTPGSAVISAPDAYLYGSGIRPTMKVQLKDVINRQSLDIKAMKEFLGQIKNKMSKMEKIDLFTDTKHEIIEMSVKYLFENIVCGKTKNCEGADLSFFAEFGIIVKGSNLTSEIRKEFGIAASDIAGYRSVNGTMIYIGGIEKWRLLPKIPAPEHLKEQGPVIGFLEEAPGKIMFKIRHTLHEIENEIRDRKITDERLVEMGSSCITWIREDLMKFYKTISRRTNKYIKIESDDSDSDDKSDKKIISVRDLCEYLRQQLMAEDYYMGGHHRTFYWYFETLPNPRDLM